MAMVGSWVPIFDNSGAKWVKCFNIIKKKSKKRPFAITGDLIKASVKKHVPHKKVAKKDTITALLVTSKIRKLKSDGRTIRHDETRGVLVQKARFVKKGLVPVGSKVRTPISRFFLDRDQRRKWAKLRSVSKGTV